MISDEIMAIAIKYVEEEGPEAGLEKFESEFGYRPMFARGFMFPIVDIQREVF